MEGRPLYRTVAALGLAAHALSSVVHYAFSRSPFFLILLAVAAVAATVTWRWVNGIWVSLVVGLALEVMTFWFVFPMTMGFTVSALDAVPALIGFVGVWTAIIASIRGVMKRREGRAFSDATKRKVLIGVGVIALLGMVSTGLTFANKETVSADEAAGATEVRMHDLNKFTPTKLEASSGEESKFVVYNDDPIGHTFTLEGYDVNEAIGPKSSKVITFTPSKSGTVELVCEFHSGMKGEIVVS